MLYIAAERVRRQSYNILRAWGQSEDHANITADILTETDLRGMRTIRCEVASSDTPIGRMERLNPDVLRSRLATWGRIIQSEAAVTPDTRD